jgi:hypothetical protein
MLICLLLRVRNNAGSAAAVALETFALTGSAPAAFAALMASYSQVFRREDGLKT